MLGSGFQVLEFDASTKTASDAAAAIGCEIAQIAKSIIFRAAERNCAVLVIASGTNRVDETKVAALLGEPLAKADADFVRMQTGYAIGGVAPVGLAQPAIIFIDQDLAKFASIWAAAGTPNAVFQLTFADLVQLTAGAVADVAR